MVSPKMVSPKQVCVIGAGVSGLAAAKAFSTRGHKVTIVECSADLGGVWEPARSYPEVQTQSPKDLYRYTDRAMRRTIRNGPRDRRCTPISTIMRRVLVSIACSA
jgi:cation diffusion facilitator CzcD-associated flavoprotein CzcO